MTYESLHRNEWILSYPCQVVLTLDQAIWVNMIETRFLLEQHVDDMDDEVADIEDYYTKISIEMYSIIDLLKTNITQNQRKLLQSLITQNVN